MADRKNFRWHSGLIAAALLFAACSGNPETVTETEPLALANDETADSETVTPTSTTTTSTTTTSTTTTSTTLAPVPAGPDQLSLPDIFADLRPVQCQAAPAPTERLTVPFNWQAGESRSYELQIATALNDTVTARPSAEVTVSTVNAYINGSLISWTSDQTYLRSVTSDLNQQNADFQSVLAQLPKVQLEYTLLNTGEIEGINNLEQIRADLVQTLDLIEPLIDVDSLPAPDEFETLRRIYADATFLDDPENDALDSGGQRISRLFELPRRLHWAEGQSFDPGEKRITTRIGDGLLWTGHFAWTLTEERRTERDIEGCETLTATDRTDPGITAKHFLADEIGNLSTMSTTELEALDDDYLQENIDVAIVDPVSLTVARLMFSETVNFNGDHSALHHVLTAR